MSQLRQILLGAGLLAALAGYLWLTHARLHRAESRATTAETTARDLRGALVAAHGSERIVTRYVDRVQVVHERGATIVQKVPVYVTAQADAQCTLPLGFVRLHDAAATSATLPDSAGAADARPSGVALSTASRTIVGNYTTCHATAAQLTALQDWVRANSEPSP